MTRQEFNGMIDIHTHILPELDDGERSWEEAVARARGAVKDGIEVVVATRTFMKQQASLRKRSAKRPANFKRCWLAKHRQAQGRKTANHRGWRSVSTF